MKILIFLFTFLGIAQVLDAQTSKGTFLLGGNASFQRAKEQSILSINPNVGYFVADRFVAGLNAGINSLSDLTFISLGPNLRGYFLTSEKGSIFATAGFNYVRVNINNNSDSSTGYNLGIGYAVFRAVGAVWTFESCDDSCERIEKCEIRMDASALHP